ncbi:NUDIX hydrolase [Dorea amylophila]|mgnify:FL=1|uniref:NUDIX hydrolase n=1 Tax=Dorea amylophila TaxID=2981789 RepID=A0ABW8AXR6_9FIRM
MSEDVKRMGRELAYQGTVLKVYKDHMKFSNGNTEDWDFIHHDGAAAVIPVMDDGKILMVKQYRNALERDTLEIPAGKLDDPDEEGIVCASRELKEETGYSSDDLEWLLTIRTTVAFCNERIEVFVARNLVPGEQHLDEDEFVDVKAYKLEELKEMIFEGKIQDSKTMAAILAYESKYLHGQNA